MWILLLGLASGRETTRAGAFLVDRWGAADGAPPAVQAVAVDRQGALWLAAEGGMWRFDGASFELLPADRLPPDVCAPFLDTWTSAADGRLWLHTQAGSVCSLDPGGDEPARCWALPPGPLRREGGLVHTADGRAIGPDGPAPAAAGVPAGGPGAPQAPAPGVRDRDGVAWIVEEGVLRADGAPLGLGAVRGEPVADPHGGVWVVEGGVPSRVRRALARVEEGGEGVRADALAELGPWVVVPGRGLCHREGGVGVAPRCLDTRDDGLPRDLSALQQDEFGRLWLGSSRGVTVLAPAAWLAALSGAEVLVPTQTWDHRDGLPADAVTGASRLPDGRLRIHAAAGVASFDPRELALDTPPAPTLSRSGEVLRWSVSEPLRPEQLWFRWRVGDGAWSLPTRDRRVRLPALGPEDTRVEVQAALGAWGPVATLPLDPPPAPFDRLGLLGVVAGAAVPSALALVSFRRRRRREARLAAELAGRTADLADSSRTIRAQEHRLERQAAEIAQMAALKSRLVANLSHELRTPLMLVTAPLEALEQRAEGPDAETLRLVRRNAARLGELVDQLFDAARVEGGRLPVRMRQVELRELVLGLAERARPSCEAAGLRLEVEAGAPAAVWGDPDLLEKILTNLLGNALKFTPAGGRVKLELAGDADTVRVSVADSGVGIAAEELPKIFERFYQVDKGDDRRAGGAGIGLALARELAELHGGAVSAESTLGVGSRFTLQLPLGALHVSLGDIDPEPTPPAARTAEAPADGPYVLVVEDHAELRAWIASALAETWAVRTAAGAAEALEHIRAARPALVLSDVMMPGTDGLSLTRALKADPATADLPVVLVSARGGGTDAEAQAAGADGWLQKPVALSVLLETVDRYLPRPAAAGSLTQADRETLARIEAAARKELANPAFGVEDLGRRVGMSRRTLQRSLVRLVGRAPNTWLQELRLERARAELLAGRSVAEAAEAVGFSPSYLARLYVAWYGRRPSEDRARSTPGR